MPDSHREVDDRVGRTAGSAWTNSVPAAAHASAFAAAHSSNGEPTVAAVNLKLLASLNHEIRTPLSGILGMTDLLLETGLSDEQAEYVSAARECAEALFDLLNATLEYSSLQAGCIQLELSEFQPGELVDAAAEEAASRARARGMEMVVRKGSGMDWTMVGDTHRIRQVVGQILNSVIRYGSGDWFEFEAEVVDQESQPVLVLEVCSEGAALQTGSSMTGADLATAVVQGLVRLLGGTMKLGYEDDRQGQRFSVRIPIRVASMRGRSLTSRDAGRVMRVPKILVVDDNRISQQVIGALLGKGGWQFHTAPDGFAALEAASKQSYQLILMDLQMPGMDGIETTARLRQLPGYAETPVMALTADVSDQVRAKCREAGMNAFLEKPIHTVELNALLGQFLTSPDGD